MKLYRYRSVQLTTFLIVLASVSEVMSIYAIQYFFSSMNYVIALYGATLFLRYLNLSMRTHSRHRLWYQLKDDVDEFMNKKEHSFLYSFFLKVYIEDVPYALEWYLGQYFHRVSICSSLVCSMLVLGYFHYQLIMIIPIMCIVRLAFPYLVNRRLSNYVIELTKNLKQYQADMKSVIFLLDIEKISNAEAITQTNEICMNYFQKKLKSDNFTAVVQTLLDFGSQIVLIISLVFVSYNIEAGSMELIYLIPIVLILQKSYQNISKLFKMPEASDELLDMLSKVEVLTETLSKDKERKNN